MVAIVQAAPVVYTAECKNCKKEEGLKAGETPTLEDRITLSEKAQVLAEGLSKPSDDSEATEEDEGRPTSQAAPAGELQLTEEERRVVQELKTRDREVRAHEAAHKGAAGPYANGGPTFEYQTGPDGKRYAVGGEVSIDVSPVANNPRATIQKAQTVRRAANAPRNPSAQDRAVAAQASRLEAEARKELQKERAEEQKQALEQSNGGGAAELGGLPPQAGNPVASVADTSGDDFGLESDEKSKPEKSRVEGSERERPEKAQAPSAFRQAFTESGSSQSGSLLNIIS